MTLRAVLPASIILAALLGGCVAQQSATRDAADQLDACEESRQDLQRQVEDLQFEVEKLRRQVEDLQSLGDKRLDLLYHVQSVELARHTGGVNLDETPGDDGIRVHLRPKDARGDTIKAAGSVTVELYDLAAPQADNLIGRFDWDVEQVATHWSGGFVTYQYTFDCPWPTAPPAHDEVTVRVEFLDYLTGQRFTAQAVARVNLPPQS